jgi:DNA recombination protein RmuC
MVVIVALAALLLGGLVVYIWQQRSRRPLESELDAARTDAAVAKTRADDAERRLAELAPKLEAERNERQQSAVERQRLQTTNEALSKQFDDTKQELTTARGELRDVERARDERNTALQLTQSHLKAANERAEKLESAAEQLETQRLALSEQLASERAQFAALSVERASLKEQLEKQKAWIDETTQRFKQDVLTAATTIMEERGRALSEANVKEVENIVGPFKERLNDFRQRVDEIYNSDTRERGELRQQIVTLTDLNRQVSDGANRLVNALTISSKSAGTWGETILERILEESGLRRDHEYRIQVSIKGPDGETLQPDAVLYLPEDRQLVVDSKVSNKAWTDYCNAATDEEREILLNAHLLSIRNHVKGLSAKEYSGSPDLQTVDFVILFVPIEAALLAALAADPHLYSESYRAKIILVSPSTLMAVVKLVEGLWTLQRRKQSADEIAEAGRKLYEKLTNFAQTFVDVGEAIEDSRRAYEKARGQLATGKGNAIGLAEKLKELGVTPAAGKQMPAELLIDQSADLPMLPEGKEAT